MHSKLALLITLFFLLVPEARSQAEHSGAKFTLQVASFPDGASADKFVSKLKGNGEHPVWGTVDLPGRGQWIRVYIGTFRSVEAAENYAGDLIRRGVIKEYLIKTGREIASLSRPRIIARNTEDLTQYASSLRTSASMPGGADPEARARSTKAITSPSQPNIIRERDRKASELQNVLIMNGFIETASIDLPRVKKAAFDLAPMDATSVPRPDPVQLAFGLIAGEPRSDYVARNQKGGLWLSGDLEEAATRLRWIVGSDIADVLSIDGDGRVTLNKQVLAEAAGINQSNAIGDPLTALNYICSNEGLLLLVQLTESPNRYCLHVGKQAPTLGEVVEVSGSINLDNNYDSRINPYRRLGKKLDKERPPAGFDSIVAINPVARWFNLRQQLIVPVGHITFHELAEAHAKLELELDYLGQGTRPGAHNVALERERSLKLQRPFSDVIVTTGSNRVLRSEEEIKLFYSQNGISVSQR